MRWLIYCKNPKRFVHPKNIAVIILKFEQHGFKKVMHLNFEGIANSADPDLTLEEQSDLGMHCLRRPVCPKDLGLLWYIFVF